MEFYHLGDRILRRMLNVLFRKRCFRNQTGNLCYELCVGGQTVSKLRRRLRDSRQPRSPWNFRPDDANVVLMVGTNDALNGFNEQSFQRNLRWLLRDLWSMRVHNIFLCTIPPLRKNRGTKNVEAINRSVKIVCREGKATIVDVHGAFLDHSCMQRLFER